MSTATADAPATATGQSSSGDLTDAPRSPAADPRWWGRKAIMPLFLAAVLVGLYLWTKSQDLDSVSSRRLTPSVLQDLLTQHLYLSAVAACFIVGIAVPLGIVLTRPWARRATPVALGLANIGQASPAIGFIALAGLLIATGERTAILAITVYGLLPVLRNTLVGLQGVPDALIDAGRGMGMSSTRVLLRVELPLAVPVILAGIRTALILAVGVATLAFFIGGGGLGSLIDAGQKLQRIPLTVVGGVLTAVLALFIDWLAGLAEDLLRPRGL